MASSRKLAVLGVSFALLIAWPVARAAAEGDSRGAQLYGLCQQCHGVNGGGNAAYLAPSIAGVPEWYLVRQLHKFHDGIRGTHFDDLSGMRMRPMALWLKNDEDMAAVAAYVAAMPPVKPAPLLEGGDAARGAALYAPCIACHGAEAKGNEVLGAPPLDQASDWYLLTQLDHYKRRIRGANPLDVQGAGMLGMVTLLPDQQAMKDVIAYIMTLSK
jgi:cytochrome c oxidase subunit 2